MNEKWAGFLLRGGACSGTLSRASWWLTQEAAPLDAPISLLGFLDTGGGQLSSAEILMGLFRCPGALPAVGLPHLGWRGLRPGSAAELLSFDAWPQPPLLPNSPSLRLPVPFLLPSSLPPPPSSLPSLSFSIRTLS